MKKDNTNIRDTEHDAELLQHLDEVLQEEELAHMGGGMSAGELSFWLSDTVPLPGTTVG